jgi:hypothetical protein
MHPRITGIAVMALCLGACKNTTDKAPVHERYVLLPGGQVKSTFTYQTAKAHAIIIDQLIITPKR